MNSFTFQTALWLEPLIHWCSAGEMDNDEDIMKESTSPAHVRIGSTLPARYVLECY